MQLGSDYNYQKTYCCYFAVTDPAKTFWWPNVSIAVSWRLSIAVIMVAAMAQMRTIVVEVFAGYYM